MSRDTGLRAYRDGRKVVIVDDDEMETVATIHKGAGTDEQRMATAAIFAASPDMLETLKRLEYGSSFPENEYQRTVRDVCRIAIAKAEGRQ